MRQVDGSTVAIDTAEFKVIIQNHIALTACDSVAQLQGLKIRDLERIMTAMQGEVSAYAAREQQLTEAIEEEKPGRFNNFLTGFATATALVFTAALLLN